MKVVIIEDELLVARDLANLLQRIDPHIEVVVILESVQEATNYFKKEVEADLIFSDIQLSDGVSFEIFEKRTIKKPVIFTTAYDEFAIRAFKINSIDYLLKPLDEEDVKRAIEKYKTLFQEKESSFANEYLQRLLKDLQPFNEKKYKTRFSGHLGQALVAIHESQVAYFTKDVLIFLFTLDHQQIITDYHSLEELVDLLDPDSFFRANRQYILHINAIDHIKPHYTGKLLVELKKPLKSEVIVSREKAGEFKKWFEGNS